MLNQDRHIAVWNNCLQIIANNIDQRKFDTWFKPIRPVKLEGSRLTVEVPSDFFRDYIETWFMDLLKATLRRAIGADAQLFYTIPVVRNQEPMFLNASNGPVPENNPVSIPTYQASGNPSPFIYPGYARVKISSRLKAEYCFANLVEGDCNKMGVSAGESISLAPGKTPFNPLFLFGGPGLGKTHIAQAIGIDIKERFQDKVVLYVTGNEFKTQYMDAVKNNRIVDFIAFYQRIDVLIVDDIHELVGKGSQDAFFNVFNHLHQNGKQLIFTSDRAPVDLQNFEERLMSRFKWGLSVELSRPDFKTRLEMLRSRAMREGVPLSEDVLNFLANRINTNFRELEGSLTSLVAYATLGHREITLDLAESVTGKIVGETETQVNMDLIVKTVCEYFNITRDMLLSKTRKRQIVQARQIAMYECRNLISNCSLSTIGSELGGKDHATVLHACSTVQDLMSTDKLFRQWVQDIENMMLVTVEA
ncbi:MAG: chromosomal replication initiator protein DnaA [Bacteroidales bacterium]|nr:chromosomal replication initiator protein DnaA [Bacteroidales bacterium]MBP5373655.1 chromosomal replication initiator protein DnaA [Bacteroidales bacterium]